MIPQGLCQCGCGERTSIAPQSHTAQGWIKGQPVRFKIGHGNRRHPHGWDEQDRGYTSRCWIWRGAKVQGYAKRGTINVFREMWEKVNGPVPESHELDHLCRQRDCINPDHLEAVTHAENIRRGKTAKIDQELALRIRGETGSLRAIGARYGLHHTTILAIKRGEAWL